MFAEDNHNSELNDAHLLLQNVFNTEEEFVFQDEDEDEVRFEGVKKRSGTASFLLWPLGALGRAIWYSNTHSNCSLTSYACLETGPQGLDSMQKAWFARKSHRW